MPGPDAAPAGRGAPAGAAARIGRAAAAGCLAVLAAAGLAGCYARASAGTSISIGTAYVPVPSSGETVAYLVIRNDGRADRLVGARTSVGGQVSLRAPEKRGSTVMRTVGSIAIPAHSTVRLAPNGLHLLIRRARPMRSGKAITLILRFAHAGSVSVVAPVTNPQTGGGGLFY